VATEKVTWDQFITLMEELREAYPSQMSKPQSEWVRTVRRYFQGVGERPGLGQYSEAVLKKALPAAKDQIPRFFPTLGQLQPICHLERQNQQRRAVVDVGVVSEPDHPELEEGNPVNRVIAQLEAEGPPKSPADQKRRVRLLCQAVGNL
jgi:hypothetical protein